MKISEVKGRGVTEDTFGEDVLEPRMIRDDKPWVKWYEEVRELPVISRRFRGKPYEKLDQDQRLLVKNLHLEATKRKKTIDEAAADNIYISELVKLFGELEAARSQAEADKVQRKIIAVLGKARDADQLAADAFEEFTKSVQEQAAPAPANPAMPAGGWKMPELPSLQQFVQQKYGVQPGTLPGAPANINVKPQGAAADAAANAENKAGGKVMGAIEKFLSKYGGKFGGRAGAAVNAAATLYFLKNLFAGSEDTATQAPPQQQQPAQVGPMGTSVGSQPAAPVQSPSTPSVGPMSVPVGGDMPAPMQGTPDKPMGTAIGAMPAQQPSPVEIPPTRIDPSKLPDPDAPVRRNEPEPQPIEAPRRQRPQVVPMPPPVEVPAQEPAPAVEPQAEPAPAQEPQPAPEPAQEPQKAPVVAPTGQQPVAPAQEPSVSASQPQFGDQPPVPPSGGSGPAPTAVAPPTVTPTGTKPADGGGTTSQAPTAPPSNSYSGLTFKQAFARARQRAEELPDSDPAKYTFYWTNPATGETKPYQTNYQGSGTRRRPQEPYIPQSRQRGTMSTAPIANPYENPDQFRGKKGKKRKKSTNEAAWAKAQMLRMNRHAPASYGRLVQEFSRPRLLSALMEMDASGLSRDVTDNSIAELYILRARQHMDKVDDPHIMENARPSDIARAISHRLMHSGLAAKLVKKHGLDNLMDAIGEVAEFHQGAEELGSSDISIMVDQVLRNLGDSRDEYEKAYESSTDFIGSIRDAVSKSVTGDNRGAAQAFDKAKNTQNNSNLPIATNSSTPGNGAPAKPGSLADHIGKAVDASKKGDKQGMQKAIDAAKAVTAVSKPNDPENKKLLANLSESPSTGDVIIMELADGRLLQARIAESSGRSLVVEMDDTGLQWLEESPDHSALKIGDDGKRVSAIAERWNAMVDDLAHDTPQGWAAVFSAHAPGMGADPADMPRMWGKIWRQQHAKLGDSLTRQDQAEWADDVSESLGRAMAEGAGTDGQFMRHRLSMKDPAMLAVWMKSQSGVRGEPVKKFARHVAAKAGKPEDAYWGKIQSLVSEKENGHATADAEDMIAAGFSDDQIAKVTGMSHKHIRKLRAKVMDRPQEYRESTTGYSEPYEVGRKQGMHNISSNPYSKGSPASQKWSAGHMAAAQGLGEETSTANLGREISLDHAIKMFGKDARDLGAGKGWRAQFFRDGRGDNWRIVVSPDGKIYVDRDTMMEGKADGAVAIDRFFGGMAASLVQSVIRRAGLLAMQGRHAEAEAALRQAMSKADPEAAKQVMDKIRQIKPVTAGSKTADTSALEKSAEHTDWLDNTFVPWVMKGLGLNEAEYHGKQVPLGKPIRTNTSSGGKFKVYVRDPKTGNIKMVRFGDTTGLSIKRDDPKRRKSFRARHHCDNPGPRTKARYWSCRMWTRKPVGKILKGK